MIWFLLVACGVTRNVRKGDRYLEQQHYPAAIRAYNDVLQKNPDHVRALTGTAEAWILAGHPERALSAARRGVRTGSVDARILLVEALVLSGRGSEAIEQAELALGETNESPKLVRLLGEAKLAGGQIDDARKVVDVGLEWSDDRALLTFGAYLAYRDGDRNRSVDLLNQAVGQLGVEDIATVEADAAALFTVYGMEDRARESINVLKGLVTDADTRFLMQATMLDEAGSDESAIRVLHWAAALRPEDGRIIRHIGLLFHGRREWKHAIEFLANALDTPPYRGQTIQGDIAVLDNVTSSMTAAELRAETLDLLRALGDCHYQLGQASEAASAWGTALQLNPNATAAEWLRIAQIWERAKQPADAVQAGFKAIEHNPRNAEAQFLLARNYAALGQVNQAVGHGRLAWEVDHGNPDVALLLGKLYEGRQDFHAAYRLYNEALEKHTGHKGLKSRLRKLHDREL